MTDDLAALPLKPKIDLSINLPTLVTIAVLSVTVVVTFTTSRERLASNTEDIVTLKLQQVTAAAEMAEFNSRLLTIETGIPYRIQTVEQINDKLEQLMRQRGAPEPENGDRR